MTNEATSDGRTFHPRPFKRGFDGVSRHWFADNVISTQLVNAINVFFPTGEMFFVKAVRHFEKRIDGDPELRRQVRAFYAQEGRHANAHERWFEEMRAQGYDFEKILHFVEHLLHERSQIQDSPEMRLSITAALEHYTAIMGELVFVDPYFQRIHPKMRDLLAWHAAEEIEHKAVAFDVLKRVNPSYRLRMTGFAVATIGLMLMWGVGTASLVRQDRLPLRRVFSDLLSLARERVVDKKIFGRAIATYVKRDFHPLQHDDFHLVRDYLKAFEEELAAEAA